MKFIQSEQKVVWKAASKHSKAIKQADKQTIRHNQTLLTGEKKKGAGKFRYAPRSKKVGGMQQVAADRADAKERGDWC